VYQRLLVVAGEAVEHFEDSAQHETRESEECLEALIPGDSANEMSSLLLELRSSQTRCRRPCDLSSQSAPNLRIKAYLTSLLLG
jgi:hypothetical protein